MRMNINKKLAEDTDSLLDSDNMEAEAEVVLSELPDDGVEGKHDVEELAESMKDTFWKAYLTNGTSLQENFNIGTFIKNYIAEHGDSNIDDIAAALPDEKAGLYYKQHRDELAKRIAAVTGKPVATETKSVFDPGSLTNDLAKELAGQSVEETILTAADSAQDKFDTIRSVARTILQGKGIKHHGFIYGDAGCGKTFSVKEAMKYDFPNGPLARKGYTIEFNAGDIGRSASAIVAFFYKNKDKKVIILDDCDAFLLSKDQAVQNLLKGMLDLDNTEKNPKYITVAPQIRKLANKIIDADSNFEEGVEISIDQDRLRENVLTVSINGEEVLTESISDKEKSLFATEKKHTAKEKIKELNTESYFGLDLLAEDEELDDDDLLTDEEFNELADSDEPEGIPPKWRFTSRLIMISNLRKTDLNDAVLSRTLSFELSLTQDEFIARLGQILPNMLTDVETEDSAEVVQYAKNVAYAYLMAAVDLAKNGGSVAGKPVKIIGKMQFRIIAELAGKWMQRADNYAVKHGIEGTDKDTLNKINNAIKLNFFVFDVMPSLVIN